MNSFFINQYNQGGKSLATEVEHKNGAVEQRTQNGVTEEIPETLTIVDEKSGQTVDLVLQSSSSSECDANSITDTKSQNDELPMEDIRQMLAEADNIIEDAEIKEHHKEVIDKV
jgi:hypothetical protein